MISDSGWLSGGALPVAHIPSPNFNNRPESLEISLLVIHNISLPPGEFGGEFIEQFFCNKLDAKAHPYFSEIDTLQVSAHFLIRRSGEIVQFVSVNNRAWHAGVSNFNGRENCNDFSIGVELEGSDDKPFAKEQYSGLVWLTQKLMANFNAITPDRIVGHSDIAPGRKTDPGPLFDWQTYRQMLSD